MKIYPLIVLSVLLVSCIENQTQRKVRSNEVASPGTPLSENSQAFSLKRIGHRCELILENEIKDIFLRTKLDDERLRLILNDYQEDGSLAIGLASIGDFRVGTVHLQKNQDSEQPIRWVGETTFENSRLRVRLNADPFEAESHLSGSIQVVDIADTEQRTLATIENCELIEALQVGIK